MSIKETYQRLTSRLHTVLALVLFVLCVQAQGFAQCAETGFVLSRDVKCGAQILNTHTGEMFWAIAGADDLATGALCSFEREAATNNSTGCTHPASSLFVLTCATRLIDCKADFFYQQDETDALTFLFDATVSDPVNQVCSWSFGDGTDAQTGINVKHQFSEPKQYQVCLTVSNPLTGCSEQKCYSVDVTAVNLKTCGQQAYITSMDLNLMGELKDLSQGKSVVQSVQWLMHKTNTVIGDEKTMSFPLPQYGEYTVCAQYQTLLHDGSTCVSKDCEVIEVSPASCRNTQLQTGVQFCPTVYTPVCGCDGNTYGNECEAMLNGITTWWLGTCAAAGSTTCTADFSYEYISGSLDQGFWVRFRNLSVGAYSKGQLDFGDGTPVLETLGWDTVSHFYPNAGLFLANLTVWKSDTEVNSVSKVVITDSQSALTSSVPTLGNMLPGDTDGSHRANVRDLLNLGLGYFNEGTPRPNAVVAWEPQMAPNWEQQTAQSVNFKHFDSDGNGKVNELDANAITLFYQKLEQVPMPTAAGKPEVRVRFLQDTLVIDPNQQASIDIAAELYVGKATNPVQNLYGFSAALEYPQYANSNTIAFYTGEQFFGQSNQILWLQKNHFGSRQLDLGFVRKNHTSINGFGRVAQINVQSDIIIIIDLIERQAAPVLPFTIKVHSVDAIDELGNPLDISVPAPDTLWIKVLPTTDTQDPQASQQTRVYPNPVTDALNMLLPEGAQSVQLTDALGRTHRTLDGAALTGSLVQLNMQDLPNGVYTLVVKTARGVVTREVVKM